MSVEKVTNATINEMQNIYSEFSNVAIKDFLFEAPPLSFSDFKANFQNGFLHAYISKENDINGFLLYTNFPLQSIEITLIYAKNNNAEIKKNILQKFLSEIEPAYNKRTISYPLLGIQDSFAEETKQFGFSFVEQIVLEHNFSQFNYDFKNPSLPQNYTVDTWKNEYLDDATETVFREFSQQSDSKFDERFNNPKGVKQILECIVSEEYGTFLPDKTTVILHKNVPVGFCFINLTTKDTANIPLLVIKKEHQGNKFATLMIKNSLNKLKKSNLNLINATTDPQNISALKSYTNANFNEKYRYKHAYKQIYNLIFTRN